MPDLRHHRPRFHIAQSLGYLNDPNGPVELNGTTHLFFQSRPTTDTALPVEWGHATSDDLVTWTLHPPALRPTPGGLDDGGCWSGTTLLTDEGLRAFYSGHDEARPLEWFLTALSRDDGATFGPPSLMLPDPDPAEGVRMLRDPFVWRGEDGIRMVAGCAIGDRAGVRIYDADAAGWHLSGETSASRTTTADGTDTGEGWECPQVIRVGGREYVLTGSWSFAGGPGSLLAFPLEDASQATTLDAGDSLYAPSVMRDSSHGSVVFGWLRETRTPDAWIEAGWSGAISLPRHLRTAERGGALSVCSYPIPALERLRRGRARGIGDAVAGAQVELVLEHRSGSVRLEFAEDEWLDVHVDLTEDTVVLDRARSSRDERSGTDPIVIRGAFDASSERDAVRLFLDGSTVEVFTSAGGSASTRVYPETPPPWRVTGSVDGVLWDLASTVLRDEVPSSASSVA